MFILIEELIVADASELQFIAQSESYFGLTSTSSVEERLDIRDEEAAMRTTSTGIPSAVMKGE